MVVLIQRPLVLCRGPGAHQAHIPFQHVQELGEFVQAGFADEFANAGLFRAVRQDFVADDPGVPVQLEHEAPGNPVFLEILLLDLIRIGDHAAELVHLKNLAVAADALLGVENGTGVGQIDGGTNEERQGRRKHAANQAAHNVNQALHRRGPKANAVAVNRQNIVAPQVLHRFHAAAQQVPDVIQA